MQSHHKLAYPGLRQTAALAVMTFLLGVSAAPAAETLTYSDLVGRLTDLEHLARLPAPGEFCAQWSSYDRASTYDAVADKYIGWDANGDGDGIIRKEGDKLVLAEMRGPGCIWRIWSANPFGGKVTVYLDDQPEPVIDLPFKRYFDGQQAPFNRSALVHTVARGWNNYTPIPYQKSCKIVAEPGWGQYYQFVYSTFAKDTTVPTFKLNLGAEDLQALDRANERLAQCGPITPEGEGVKREKLRLEKGREKQSLKLDGPAAIALLRIKVSAEPNWDDMDGLRSLVLQIRWDGDPQAAVWSPLGDFFGTAPGANKYRSLPLGLTEDGWFYCNWHMPFAQSAEITLLNENGQPVAVDCEITTKPLALPAAQLTRFHAKWHRDEFLPTNPALEIDWPFLKTTGAGRFVGLMLHIWNPRGGWWGEGDEKFFVDGERFPSTIGTGSEDYFGYAWCDPALFQNAFHNQTRNDGNNRGHVSVNRWQIPDAVPFHQSFAGDIEKYYPNKRPTLYAAVAYWYLNAGGDDPYHPLPVERRIGYCTPVETFKFPGVIEGEKLKILAKSRGNPHEQDLLGFGEGKWSNDAQLWWVDAGVGDTLELAVPVPNDGKYAITANFTKARDYGIVKLSLDGEPLMDGPVDFYNPEVVATGPVSLGTHQLSAGDHRLKVEIVGANPAAVKSHMFGLDYIKLEAQP